MSINEIKSDRVDWPQPAEDEAVVNTVMKVQI
jgi:hypothetical protein